MTTDLLTANAPALVQPKDLADFADWLMETEYGEYLALFNPLAFGRQGPVARRSCLTRQGVGLFDFFTQGAWLNAEFSDVIPPWVMALLDKNGLLRHDRETGNIALANLTVNKVFWMCLFAEQPSVAMSLYFGDDTIALLNRLRPRQGDRVLDLCTGPGTQAIWCAPRASEVVGVDINPLAAGLASVNARLNRINNSTFLQGDLVSPVRGEKFDFVCANTPLVPVADDLLYGLIGHGGPDGCAFIYRILDALPDILTDHGRFQTLGLTTSDGILPTAAARFEEFAQRSGLGVIMTVVHHNEAKSGSLLLNRLAGTAKAFGDMTGDNRTGPEVQDIYLESLNAQGATHLCDFYLLVSKEKKGFELVDVSIDGDAGMWYVPS